MEHATKKLAATQRVILGEARLAGLFGRTASWIAKLERDQVIGRLNKPGERALYDLEKVSEQILEHVASVGRRQFQAAKLAEVRERTRKLRVEIAIKEGRLIDKEELFRELEPRMLKIRKALEEALRAGVPRPTVERIAAIMKEGTEGIIEDGPEHEGGQERRHAMKRLRDVRPGFGERVPPARRDPSGTLD